MPVKFLMEIFSSNDILLDRYSGFYVRAIFFNLLSLINEDVATAIHESKEVAPYSVSPLMDHKGRTVYYKIKGGRSYFFWIAVHEENILLKTLKDAIFRLLERPVEDKLLFLKDREVLVVSASTIQKSYNNLLKECYEGMPPLRKFSIKFSSPCFFRRPRGTQGSVVKYIPLPLPESILGSPLKVYCKYAGCDQKFVKEYLEWLNNGGILISGYKKGIRTKKVIEDKSTRLWYVGFVGDVGFSLADDTYDERFAKFTEFLLKLAEFTNVGANRTAGFGVIQYRRR